MSALPAPVGSDSVASAPTFGSMQTFRGVDKMKSLHNSLSRSSRSRSRSRLGGLIAVLGVLGVAMLGGCASEEHQNLKEWMRDQTKGMRGKVPPLPEITAFPVVAYEASDLTSPFSPAKIVSAEIVVASTAPDRTRPPQPLEAFALEELRVMGVILSGATPYALMQTPPPSKPKHVGIGEYMGQNFGKITSITKDGVIVLETVRDVNGAWTPQEKLLQVPKEGGY